MKGFDAVGVAGDGPQIAPTEQEAYAMGDHERAALTAEERRILAEIEAELSGKAAVKERTPPPPVAHALLLFVAGFAVVVATFTWALWLAVGGLVLAGVGLGAAIDRITRRAAPNPEQ